MQPRKHIYTGSRTAVISATSCTTIPQSPGCGLRTSMSLTRMAKRSSLTDILVMAGDWDRRHGPKVRPSSAILEKPYIGKDCIPFHCRVGPVCKFWLPRSKGQLNRLDQSQMCTTGLASNFEDRWFRWNHRPLYTEVYDEMNEMKWIKWMKMASKIVRLAQF